MTPAQAVQILALEPGKEYRERELEEAAERAKRRAQNLARRARTEKAHEEALQTLRQIPEARQVLKQMIRGGTFRVPGGGSSSSAATIGGRSASPSGSAATGRFGSGLLTRLRQLASGIGSAVATPVRVVVGAVRNKVAQNFAGGLLQIASAAWLLGKIPIRQLGNRRYVRAVLTVVVLGAMGWTAVSFLTGGVRDVSSRLRQGCRRAVQFMGDAVRNGRSSPEDSDESLRVDSEVSGSIKVRINGTPASGLDELESGSHRIRVSAGGETLHSGRINFPHGGRVKVREESTEQIKLIIQWNGGDKQWALRMP